MPKDSMTRVGLSLLLWGAALTSVAAAPPDYGRVERQAFNRAAVRLNLPLYWTADTNGNQSVDPAEVATLLFYPTAPRWVEQGRCAASFTDAYEKIVAWSGEPPLPSGLTEAERVRRQLVLQDLDQARATLVRSDFRNAPAGDKAFVDTDALGRRPDRHALQSRRSGPRRSRHASRPTMPRARASSAATGAPTCVAPGDRERTRPAPRSPARPKPLFDVYPASLQANAGVLRGAREAPGRDGAARSLHRRA